MRAVFGCMTVTFPNVCKFFTFDLVLFHRFFYDVTPCRTTNNEYSPEFVLRVGLAHFLCMAMALAIIRISYNSINTIKRINYKCRIVVDAIHIHWFHRTNGTNVCGQMNYYFYLLTTFVSSQQFHEQLSFP